MANDAFTPRTTETRLTLPLNGSVFTTTRQVPAGKVLPVIGDTMEAELGPAWADSRIIEVATIPQNGNIVLTLTHARIPDEAGQLATNWETATADIGGQKYPSVQRTFIALASAYSENSPTAGSAMPFVAGDTFSDQGYILVNRQVQKSGMQLEPVFKVETRNYVKRCVITSIGIDPLNGETLTSTSAIYFANEIVSGSHSMAYLAAHSANTFWGLQDDGTQRTFQQLSSEWFAVATEQVVGGVFIGGVVAVSSYVTNDNYSWPPVLETLSMMNWPMRNGGNVKHANFTFHPEGYSGPCRTVVERTWSKTPFAIPQVPQMLPIRISYSCPDFHIRIPECLHATVAVNDDKGNLDQTWKWTIGTERVFPATNYTMWPASIVSFDDQEPMRGGFMRTRRTTDSPNPMASTVPGKAGAAITLTNLEQTYDGSAKAVTATTSPAGKTVIILYDWGSSAPTAAGTYSVFAYIDQAGFFGTFISNLVIDKATATMVVTGANPTYDGSPKALTVVTTPGGLTVDVTYNGSSTPPTAAGNYSYVATVNDANYQGVATGTLAIGRAAATVALTAMTQAHTGSPLAPTVTTTPGGLAYLIYYDGDITPVADVGTYAVTAAIVEANHTGSSSGTFTIT